MGGQYFLVGEGWIRNYGKYLKTDMILNYAITLFMIKIIYKVDCK